MVGGPVDITAMTRVTEFLEAEARRVSDNLASIAAGNPDVNLTMGATTGTRRVSPP